MKIYFKVNIFLQSYQIIFLIKRRQQVTTISHWFDWLDRSLTTTTFVLSVYQIVVRLHKLLKTNSVEFPDSVLQVCYLQSFSNCKAYKMSKFLYFWWCVLKQLFEGVAKFLTKQFKKQCFTTGFIKLGLKLRYFDF